MSIDSPGSSISEFLRGRVDAGDFPSAVYAVGLGGGIIFQDAIGNAVLHPEQIPATTRTIYDVASLTKVLVTTLLCARAFEEGKLSLDHRLAAMLPAFDVEGKRTILVRDLLTHTSHLPAWRPFYLLIDEPADVIKHITELDPDFSAAVIYSDLNFMVLGNLLENLYERSVEELAMDVFKKLQLTDTFFNPQQEFQRRIAATENGNGFELKTCVDQGYEVDSQNFRKHQIWGEVHDGNCFFQGGVCGHAGLFSTAGEVFKIAEQFLASRSEVLTPKTCALFTEDLTPGMNEARSLGFQLARTSGSTAGDSLSPNSFGHNGFTGTTLWIDPLTESIFILLTNRTHGVDPPFININSVRRRFHDLAVAALEAHR